MGIIVILLFFVLVTCGYIAGRDKNYVMYALLPIMVLLLSYNHLPIADPSRKAVTEQERIEESDGIAQNWKLLLIIGGTPFAAVLLGLLLRATASCRPHQDDACV
jgi:DICT domain-containing protein